MKIVIDKESHAAYIYFVDKPEDLKGSVRSEAVNADLTIDYTEDGKLFGMEVLNLNLLESTD